MNGLFLLTSALFFGAEMIIDVPEGQIVTNAAAIQAETAGDVLVKTGKGTWYSAQAIGSTVNFSKMVVREGTFENCCDFYPPTLEVAKGALLKQIGTGCYSGRATVIDLADGAVWDNNFKSVSSGFSVTGYGVVSNCAGSGWTGDSLYSFHGTLMAGTPKVTGSHLDLYDGTTHTLNEGLANLREIRGTHDDAQIQWRNVAPVTVRCAIRGTAKTLNYGPVTYTRYFETGTGGGLSLNDDVDYAAGLGFMKNSGEYGYESKVTNEWKISGAVIAGPEIALSTSASFSNSGDSRSRVKRWAAIYTGHSDYCRFVMSGGEFYCGNNLSYLVEWNGGRFYQVAGGVYNTSSYAKYDITGNGGRWCGWSDGSGCTFARTDTPLPVKIGKKGLSMELYGAKKSIENATVSSPFLSACSADETDGGLTILGRGTYVFYRPMSFTGPFETRADGLSCNLANMTGDNLFGTGDFRFGTTTFNLTSFNGETLTLAGGTGAKFVATGNGWFMCDSTVNKQPIAVTIRIAGPLASENGGVVFTGYQAYSEEDGTLKKIFSDVPVELNEAGFPKVPFLQGNWGWYGSYQHEIEFMKYDATKGFVVCRASTLTNTFEGASKSTSVRLNDFKKVILEADATAGALKIDDCYATRPDGWHSGIKGGSLDDDVASLTLSEGVTLTVGDGKAPGVLIVNSYDTSIVASVKGAGQISFGTSDGVIAMNGYPILFRVPLTGSGPVTFAAPPRATCAEAILAKPCTYAGETRIYGTTVTLVRDGALPGGLVRVGGGRKGGRLLFKREATLANDFELEGTGHGGDSTVCNIAGALVFQTNVTLNGSIALKGTSFVSTPPKGCKAVFNGAISGDEELWFFNDAANTVEGGVDTAFARDEAGTFVLTAKNPLTTRVRIVRSNVCLKGAQASLGAGHIELDSGRIRFENTAPVSFTNIVYGSGVIQLAGSGTVTFKDLLGQGGEKFTLDLARRNVSVNSLEGFGAITTAKSGEVHLSVLDDAAGSFAGSLPANVVLHYGKLYKPGLAVIAK